MRNPAAEGQPLILHERRRSCDYVEQYLIPDAAAFSRERLSHHLTRPLSTFFGHGGTFCGVP